MYKVLLVDDERLELNTLKNYVEWKKLGIEKVYTAINGFQALDIAQKKHPDIVFTDIRMPVMNGIDFASALRETDKKVKIIFLTGYDDMDYIRQAFRLTATDYILKPFLVEDIEAVVTNILMVLDQDQNENYLRTSAKEKIIDNIFKDDSQSQDELIHQFFAMENVDERFVFGVIGLYGRKGNPPEPVFFSYFPEIFYYIELQDWNLLLIQTSVDSKSVAQNIAAYLEDNQIDLGVAYIGGFHQLNEAREIRKKFEEASDSAFYMAAHIPVSLDCFSREKSKEIIGEELRVMNALRRDIAVQISHGNSRGCYERLEEYLEIGSKASARVFRNSVLRLFNHINDELIIENEDLARQYSSMHFQGKTISKLVEEANSASRIREGLYCYLDRLLSYYCSLQENANYRVILFVEDYIEKHYMEPISIESMAEEIGLSTNYVRSIFKNGSGMTINNYLSEYRLEKACKLLKNTSHKVSTIATMVGYDSVSYFGVIFQKRYGKTPNEWRRGL